MRPYQRLQLLQPLSDFHRCTLIATTVHFAINILHSTYFIQHTLTYLILTFGLGNHPNVFMHLGWVENYLNATTVHFAFNSLHATSGPVLCTYGVIQKWHRK